MNAKDQHADFMDWLPFGGLGLIILLPWITAYFPHGITEFQTAQKWVEAHKWYFSGLGLLGMTGMSLWHSFNKWDELNEKQNRASMFFAIAEIRAALITSFTNILTTKAENVRIRESLCIG